MTQKTMDIVHGIAKGILTLLIVFFGTLFMMSVIKCSTDYNKKKMEESTHVEQVIRENKDSMSAFMSVIVEANQTLVNNPRACRWLLLGSISQPCYITKDLDNKILYEKPFRESIFIWIPTDSLTWKRTECGKPLALKNPFYIGDNIYNGDMNKLRMTIIDKKDRGF